MEADFASVFVRDATDSELLRLVCAQNWPQSSARFLDRLRIRVGRGPTGRAVADRRPVEVEDVFAAPELEAWWGIARELGFTSLISLPLRGEDRVPGALTFYFAEARR
ncbi:MAG: GAF domain-containing protein, partial [Gammaproteobacteria bacterium]|nr:GAF domain-containing protein [Gemmatimonadota bacterium]NIU73897.1 GAF domain-containing protein [Gammaproteobacteria bacterium]